MNFRNGDPQEINNELRGFSEEIQLLEEEKENWSHFH